MIILFTVNGEVICKYDVNHAFSLLNRFYLITIGHTNLT